MAASSPTEFPRGIALWETLPRTSEAAAVSSETVSSETVSEGPPEEYTAVASVIISGTAKIVTIRSGGIVGISESRPGPPPGHKKSPFDKRMWIHRCEVFCGPEAAKTADALGLLETLIARTAAAVGGDIYAYVHSSDKHTGAAYKAAGYHVRGYAAGGWHIWTGAPL